MNVVIVLLLIVLVLEGVGSLSALDNLNANIAQLKTDVEAYIASKAGSFTSVEVQAAADVVANLDAEVKSAQ